MCGDTCDITKQDCFERAKNIALELEDIYNGSTEDKNDDGEPMTISDWLNDQLAVEVVSTLNKEYISCNVLIGCGGPTIELDTRSSEVICSWGTSEAKYAVDRVVCDEIDEIVEELWTIN